MDPHVTQERSESFRVWDFLHRHLALFLILISLCALILFPLADCFDCEGSNPWGRNDGAYAIRSTIFDLWLGGASLTVGYLRCRLGWTVPIAITLSAVATEPLSGVAAWSLWNNEGPIMLIFGASLGMTLFSAGLIARICVDQLRKNRIRA